MKFIVTTVVLSVILAVEKQIFGFEVAVITGLSMIIAYVSKNYWE